MADRAEPDNDPLADLRSRVSSEGINYKITPEQWYRVSELQRAQVAASTTSGDPPRARPYIDTLQFEWHLSIEGLPSNIQTVASGAEILEYIQNPSIRREGNKYLLVAVLKIGQYPEHLREGAADQ